MLDRGWTMGLGLTELPLRDGRRPVSTHVSAGLISVPALGAVRRAEKLREVATAVADGRLADDGGDKVSADAGATAPCASPALRSSPICGCSPG